MTKLSRLWMMAYDNYIDEREKSSKQVDNDFLTAMEETLIYWWPAAECIELEPSYNYLKQIALAKVYMK